MGANEKKYIYEISRQSTCGGEGQRKENERKICKKKEEGRGLQLKPLSEIN